MAKYTIIKILGKKIEKTNPSHQWKSESDTETILESFNLFGVDQTLEIIEGMFSDSTFRY